MAGATGLVGRALLLDLLREPGVQTVYAVGGRRPRVEDPKLVSLTVDFAKSLSFRLLMRCILPLVRRSRLRARRLHFAQLISMGIWRSRVPQWHPALDGADWSVPWVLMRNHGSSITG